MYTLTKSELITEINDIIDANMSSALDYCFDDNKLVELGYAINSSLDNLKSDIKELINKTKIKQD